MSGAAQAANGSDKRGHGLPSQEQRGAPADGRHEAKVIYEDL